MKHSLSLLFGLMISVYLVGCLGGSENIVAEFGGSKVPLTSFKEAYDKNTSATKLADTIDSYKNFLNLYVNFRMKLADAAAKGYEQNKDLQNELLDYKKKIGVTYILEKNLVEPNIRRLWDLRKYEYRVSHIMFRPDTSGEENAMRKANAVLDSIVKFGRPFEEMAKKYSQDNFSAKLGGDVYYFTPLMIKAPEFEDAYVSTPVGGVYPMVIKTQFGLHIVKVTEKRERIPQIRVSHIMTTLVDENGKEDSVHARLRIDSAYQELKNGADFAATAKKYSQDVSSRDNGGDLNFFERRMMVPEFDGPSFNLKVGEISGIVKTMYGYHIIKQTARKPYPSFDEDKEALKTNYKMNRYDRDYDSLAAGLRKKHHFNQSINVLETIARNADSLKIGPEMKSMASYESLKNLAMFTLDDVAYTVDTIIAYASVNSEFNGRKADLKTLEAVTKKFANEAAIEAEAMQLDKVNPEFATLMDDYKNGIYIFKLQEDEIWNKIQLDSARLVGHYEKTKEKYRWSDRVEFVELYTRNDSLAKVYAERIKNGEIIDSLAAQFTERPGYRERAGHFDLTEINGSEMAIAANKLANPGDISDVVSNSGGYSIFKLVKKEAPRVKTFDEAKAEVSGSFQEEEAKRLEEQYLQSLKQKYQPKYYYDALPKAAAK